MFDTEKGYPMKKSIETFIVLMMFTFVLPLFASRPYQPKIADPILEPWRWRSYPELGGKGVMNLTEVADGSIWFGLQEGAIRYDGLQWTSYFSSNSPLHSQVNIITQAKDGSIYFGTNSSGLIRFYHDQWELVWLPSHLDDRDQRVGCVIEASNKSIWACIWETGILSIQEDRKILITTHQIKEKIGNQYPEVSVIEIPQEVIDPVIDGLNYFTPFWAQEIAPGKILFAVNNRLVCFHVSDTSPGDEGIWMDITPERYHKYHDEVKIFKSKDELVWIFDNEESSELFQYDPQRDSWRVFDLKSYGGTNRIYSIQETPDGTIWVGDFNQFFAYKDHQWHLYRSPELELPQVDMLFLASSDGNLWIVGRRADVYRLDYTSDHWI
ncbi:hypothetical protein MUP95_00060, partial [bacterium]|nr:hypothetical protein [bacterium]